MCKKNKKTTSFSLWNEYKASLMHMLCEIVAGWTALGLLFHAWLGGTEVKWSLFLSHLRPAGKIIRMQIMEVLRNACRHKDEAAAAVTCHTPSSHCLVWQEAPETGAGWGYGNTASWHEKSSGHAGERIEDRPRCSAHYHGEFPAS